MSYPSARKLRSIANRAAYASAATPVATRRAAYLAKQAAWRVAHPLLTPDRHGQTREQALQRAEGQGMMCPICGRDFEVTRAQAQQGRPVDRHQDHDRHTGRVRGVACPNCNIMIGHAKDQPEILRRAADYLEGFE